MSADPQLLAEEIEFKTKPLQGYWAILVSVVALSWCLFQLWIASPLPFSIGWGILIDVPKRAIHLAFAMSLCFLLYGARESHRLTQLSSRHQTSSLISKFGKAHLP